MTPDREQPRARTGVVHRSAGRRIEDQSTTTERLFGRIEWAARWRQAHPSGPHAPLIVAEHVWHRALAEASI